MKIKAFKFKDFEIPSVTFTKGEMLRFWVQLLPSKNSKTEWGINAMSELLQNFNFSQKTRLCPYKVKLSIFSILSHPTIETYLSKKHSLSSKEINKICDSFNLKPNWKIRKLGFTHQYLLSIACEFLRTDFVVYHYYGLSIESEIQLTKYVKSELKKGKTAISFNDLNFKPKDIDTDKIINIELRRI